jgi:hypothetical protein
VLNPQYACRFKGEGPVSIETASIHRSPVEMEPIVIQQRYLPSAEIEPNALTGALQAVGKNRANSGTLRRGKLDFEGYSLRAQRIHNPTPN